MADERLEKLAHTLVEYCVAVKSGEWVIINANIAAMPLVEAVSRQVLRAGANLNIVLDSDDLREILFTEAGPEQLQWISPVERLQVEEASVLMNLEAASNTRVLSAMDPQKQQMRKVARRALFQTWMRRAAEGRLRWVVTQFPCQAFAQDADMSLRDYEDFVYGATFCDQPDPVACWSDLKHKQDRLIAWLQGKKQVHVHGPNSDLTLSIEGRTFINSDGKRNMPSGEIFTGPVEESVNGWVKFTYPAIQDGREVEGVELEFCAGKVVRANARKNADYLQMQLDSDPGARYLGEFAIGTNYGIRRFTKSILFDEKIGGSFHIAVGAGYPETGSHNQSSIHWDFICDLRDDSEIRVDGELFYKNGNFVIE